VAQPDVPGNLSRQAAADFTEILRRSEREWGVSTARRTRARLLLRFGQIAGGSAVGHHRDDVKPRTPTLFLWEAPWVIAYKPETRQVLRVLYGTRHFPAALPERS
jgi:plasmid stabilization system protein ParE